MSWLKNPWDKGGSLYPKFLDKEPGTMSGTSNSDKRFTFETSGNVDLHTRIDKYGFDLFFKNDGSFSYHVQASFAEYKKKNSDDIKLIYDTNPTPLNTLVIECFYPNTLEVDSNLSDTNPFNVVPNAGNNAVYNNQTLTVLDIFKTVTEDTNNKNRLSIVIIGNYANIQFTPEDGVFLTNQDRINNKPLNISPHDFMQRRATVFKNTFLTGLNVEIIDIAADDPKNTYKDSFAGDPNPLKPANNVIGISVLFILQEKSLPKF